MPKVFSDDEKGLVKKLSDEGVTHAEIGKRLAKDFPENWADLKAPERSVARILKDIRDGLEDVPKLTSEKTFDEMTREERFDFINNKLRTTPRFRLTFRNFDEDEKELFIDEYLGVVKSTDTLTEAEEQSLFASILELVLALQSLSRKEYIEKLHKETLEGMHSEGDTKYTPHLGSADKYAKEYNSHMKLYQEGMKQLKMSREQRLKEVRTERRTLVDLAEELNTRSARASAAEEIERLAKERDEELKRMLENGYLYGKFQD